jgi:acetyltransferase-like isoleucine patch superfamily enzyme
MDNYSMSEFFSNMFYFLRTKLFYRKCRFIRFPIYIRGKKSISGGTGLTTGRFCRIELDGHKKTLFIGKNCEFGDMTHLVALKSVHIGDNVLIASKCFISDTDHGKYSGEECSSPEEAPKERILISQDVSIGNNVWIGENVVILSGTNIGNGCVIGANSVVRGNFDDNEIIVGSPAHSVKKYSYDEKKWKKIV